MASTVKLAIKLEKIINLMEQGVLCGADLHEIDPSSKALIQQACLESCARKFCKGCEQSDACGKLFLRQTIYTSRET